MTKQNIKKLIYALSCAVLAAVFIVAMFFGAPTIDAVPDAADKKVAEMIKTDDKWERVELDAGKDFAAVSIEDLSDTGRITKVNYVADKFVRVGSILPGMQIVDLTKPFDFAEKGSLVFVILNLDAWAEDFDARAEALSKYKIGEYWCFTLRLPQIFSASNVYSNAKLIARNGEIANYDFTEFNTNYIKKTESFSSKTEPAFVDLQFYAKREALSNAVITIHYQSTGSAYSGITDCPVIGTENSVKSIFDNSENLLNAFGIMALVVLAILAVLSFVEKSKRFVAPVVWVFGIALMLLSRFCLCGATVAPLFWSALALCTSFVVLGGALLAMGSDIGKVPTRLIFPALAAVGALFAFLCPFIPFDAANGMRVARKVIKGVCAAALLAFIGFALFDKKDSRGILQSSCAAIITVAIIASIFMPPMFPAQINPLFWLCVAVTITTFVSVIAAIMEMKKSNVYLTNNLHKEVERQVKDIKTVISERDSLLQFISHDMQKPLVSSGTLLDTVIDNEQDAEQIKTLKIIKQNNTRVVSNLSSISGYAKYNYIAEPASVVDLATMCSELCDFHRFDCSANGILLKNNVTADLKAFAKPQGLKNALSNIIMNAVEHADCSALTLSAKPDKNRVVLAIADDGKGIDRSLDVFAPYISENNTETGGVGLYICKSIIESMNGELSFETGENGTTFYVALLKA